MQGRFGGRGFRMWMWLACWVFSHVAAVLIAIAAVESSTTLPNVSLWLIPGILATVQWRFLWGRLRWWGAAWVVAAYVGLYLSFAGAWWFGILIGLGIGVSQTVVLVIVRRFRWWWLWAPASGLGWCAGAYVTRYVSEWFGTGANLFADAMLMSGAMTVGYATATGLAMLVMTRGLRENAACLGGAGPGAVAPCQAGGSDRSSTS